VRKRAAALSRRAGAENQGRVKVPAAWLIEQAGFAKGYALGAAGYLRGTRWRSSIAAAPAQRRFWRSPDRSPLPSKERFGIRLEMEPVMVGF
jgi:UDP-N-acetylmuramate dehydrogenase